jgi:hypothetical protein
MAFKSIKAYNEERYGGFFILRNDREYEDVVFLFRSEDDALMAKTHYIKSPDYSGYVHCNDRGCAACAKGIRIQDKFFIPLYNIRKDEIQFWDRSTKFDNQFVQDVFSKYPNPSEYVFRVTRIGEAGSIDTKYDIMAIGKNSQMPYDYILSKHNVTLPEYYNTVCREVSNSELSSMLDTSSTSSGYGAPTQDYVPTPRPAATSIPDNIPETANIPESVPSLEDIGDYEPMDDVDF